FIAESKTLSGIGLALLLVASIRLGFIVEGIFNAVWGAPRRRDWLPRIAIYSLMLLALALLVGAVGLGLRRLERSPVGAAVLGSPDSAHALRFAVEWAALTLLYRFLPNASVRWSAAAAAGGVISIALELLRGLFGLYVQALSSMSLITGYLTLILLSLFSVYLGWVLILLGVELTRAVQTSAGRAAAAGGKRAGRAEIAVRMLLRLSEGEPHALRELYDSEPGEAGQAEEVLKGLLARGVVAGDPGRGYRLARHPGRITVAEVVEAVSPDLYTISPLGEDRVVLVLEPLFARLDKERRTVLGATLADLAER
ncbi:MAG: YhjD/YihY/BrkB family envelope integrity protein, partial [Thermoanaerobaculia bacterium]